MNEVTGEVYQAASGQWSFRIVRDGIEIAGGAGFADALEADAALADELDALCGARMTPSELALGAILGAMVRSCSGGR